MAIRLRDVAERLKVSPALVSCVLNNKPGAWANPEMRQRIVDTAREMNYRPHAAGRALRSARAHTVALPMYVPEGDIGRNGMILGTLSRLLSRHGYHLLVDVGTTIEQTSKLLEEVAATRACDAIVLWAEEYLVKQQAEIARQYNIPFVAKGYYDEEHPDWLQAEFDHYRMMDVAVAFLAERGHRRIAFLGHPSEELYAVKLEAGFTEAFCRHTGSSSAQEWVFRSYEPAELRQLFAEWFAAPEARRPSALIIAGGDHNLWVEVESALARTGRTIGYGMGQFAVTGLRHSSKPLLFGDACAFPYTDLSLLTEVLTKQLLFPLLHGQPIAQPIVRALPELLPCPSYHLPVGNSV